MSPKIKSALADGLGVSGYGVTLFGLYLISPPFSYIVAGLGMMAAAVLLVRR